MPQAAKKHLVMFSSYLIYSGYCPFVVSSHMTEQTLR